jgi:nucleoside-diphosphate-sugar epimerase
MRDTVLLTGATGTIGRDLVALLLQRTDADLVLLIHKNGAELDPASLLERVLSMRPRADDVSRVTVLHGDITRADLGLNEETCAHLRRRLTHILHAAASTRFDLPLEQAWLINVTGTQNVASLGLQCSALRQFGFLSTIFVSGKRTGSIEETPPSTGAGFVNTYEQSKCHAELALWASAEKLPVAVYRLSTVIGHSRTGHVHQFAAPHQAARIMHLGLGAMVPGRPDYKVDLVSSDYSALCIFELFWRNFSANRTFQLAHGEGSLTLQEVIEANYDILARLDSDWASRNYPMPAIVTPDAFDLFLDSAVSAANPALVATLRALDRFARQFVYPKQFQSQNVEAAIADYRVHLPDIREFYPRVIEYCMRSRWGKVPEHGSVASLH